MDSKEIKKQTVPQEADKTQSLTYRTKQMSSNLFQTCDEKRETGTSCNKQNVQESGEKNEKRRWIN